MRDEQEVTAANICVVSCHANSPSIDKTTRGEVAAVYDATRRLAGLGHRVDWITSPDTIDAYAHDVALVPASRDSLSPTCRHVLSCQPYRLAGVTLFAVEREVWRDRALQTRLFSFLCLLHRELKWNVMHAMGDLAAVFASVYTARFLGLPVVVSYDNELIASRDRQPFVWRWLNRHVTLASVRCAAARQRLLEVSDFTPQEIRVLGAGHLGVEVLTAVDRTNGMQRSRSRIGD